MPFRTIGLSLIDMSRQISLEQWLYTAGCRKVFFRIHPIPIVLAICRLKEIVFSGRASSYDIKVTPVLSCTQVCYAIWSCCKSSLNATLFLPETFD